MSKLRELTWENHGKAEGTEYARKLLKGMTPAEYHRYLCNQYLIYYWLEFYSFDIIKKYPSIARAKKIKTDILELEDQNGLTQDYMNLCPVVNDYIDHLKKLDDQGLLAHIYVRHFGDMYGGQIIKKRNPGSGTMYDFEDVETLKGQIRSLLNDDMADEANRCFEFAIRLFEELG